MALMVLMVLMALAALHTWGALAGPVGLGPRVAMEDLSMLGKAQATDASGLLAAFAFWLLAPRLLAAAEAAQMETALAASPASAALYPLAWASLEPPPL